MRQLFCLALLCLAASGTAIAAPGDYWHVDQWSTNVRQGPGTNHPVARQLGQGDVVMELQHRDGWLYVVMDRRGRTGWLYRELASPLTTGADEAEETAYFKLFSDMLDSNREQAEDLGETPLFLSADYLGYATVAVQVSDAFLPLARSEQNTQLDALVRLWQTVDNTGIPASVILTTASGDRLAVSSSSRGRYWMDERD
ncbi:MAG: SH3 domain-containing protein [Ectothiorhodospiraceae bacterium]|nr:SH3 domain-containing protein [Ectothiorhodospiraceae bacterium]MCH8506280.1 SH3 domain-containing protein [Ectothiorhodospiraceae bacterium]